MLNKSFMERILDKRQQTQTRIMVLLGIIQQLMSTRQNKLFAQQSLTTSQFALLTHFTHKPQKSWLISDLAQVMEMNQPGITKTVSVLLEKGLLKANVDKDDKRKRHLTITQQGLGTCESIMQSLLPDISHCFSDWQDGDLSDFNAQLETLMTWFDNHRDDIKGI